MIKFRQKTPLDPSLKIYVETKIIPKYRKFDLAHREDHAREVIERALYLSGFYDISQDLVYCAAACHDLGLEKGRDDHHLDSGKIIRGDKNLRAWFTGDDIEQMAQAAEDHRSSNGQVPRGLLGKIVSEADRVIDCQRTLERTLSFGISKFPDSSKDEQVMRAADYITEKYGPAGRIKIWIPESPNKKNLDELQALIKNRRKFISRLSEIYDKLTK